MNRIRIAIIGGGISGLYAAYLLESQGIYDYVLFEARERLGGRALSVALEGTVASLSDPFDRFDLGPSWFWPDFQPQLDSLEGLSWRLCFLIGVVVAPLSVLLFGRLPQSSIAASWQVLILGGVLVGFGTRLGGGCTSGHGICGLARRSSRSLIATATFMTTGAITVYVTRHLLGHG